MPTLNLLTSPNVHLCTIQGFESRVVCLLHCTVSALEKVFKFLFLCSQWCKLMTDGFRIIRTAQVTWTGVVNLLIRHCDYRCSKAIDTVYAWLSYCCCVDVSVTGNVRKTSCWAISSVWSKFISRDSLAWKRQYYWMLPVVEAHICRSAKLFGASLAGGTSCNQLWTSSRL